jgi:hypothetical protein
MTVYLVIFLPKIPFIHCIYRVVANPTDTHTDSFEIKEGLGN